MIKHHGLAMILGVLLTGGSAAMAGHVLLDVAENDIPRRDAQQKAEQPPQVNLANETDPGELVMLAHVTRAATTGTDSPREMTQLQLQFDESLAMTWDVCPQQGPPITAARLYGPAEADAGPGDSDLLTELFDYPGIDATTEVLTPRDAAVVGPLSVAY